MKKLFFTLFIAGFVVTSHAQTVFKTKFTPCSETKFIFEENTILAKTDNKELVNLIFQSMDEEAAKRIEGHMLLQVIVGLDGRSCLLSMDNQTNIPTEQMKIKDQLDSKLVWQNSNQVLSAVLLVVINKNGVAVKRFGKNGKGGWQVLDIK